MPAPGPINWDNQELDSSLYKISESSAAFLKKLTAIEDEEELKQHILAVQGEAFNVRYRDESRSSKYDDLTLVIFRSFRIRVSRGSDS